MKLVDEKISARFSMARGGGGGKRERESESVYFGCK